MTNMTLPDLEYLTSILSLQRPKFSIFPYLHLYAQHERIFLSQSVFRIKIFLLNALRNTSAFLLIILETFSTFST